MMRSLELVGLISAASASCGAGHTKTLTKKQKTIKSTKFMKREKIQKTGVCVQLNTPDLL